MNSTESASAAEVHLAFDMEMEMEEDVASELEDFILLSRLGVVDEALHVVEHVLWPHLHLFPVLAEVAGFLIEHTYKVHAGRIVADLESRQIAFTEQNEIEFVIMIKEFNAGCLSLFTLVAIKSLSERSTYQGIGTLVDVFQTTDYSCPIQVSNKANMNKSLTHLRYTISRHDYS